MERLTHRKGRGLEAVAMMPATNLPHFEIARAAISVFLCRRARRPLPRASFAAKTPHRHVAREKIAFMAIPFLHFPAFVGNMG
jgi:hypothetical protein